MPVRTVAVPLLSLARGTLVPAAASALLAGMLLFGYLPFHIAAELFCVCVGLSLFFVSAALSRLSPTPVLSYVGAGYFWVALLDLMHMLLYQGMNLHPLGGANASTQFWLAGRVVEALVLVTLPLLLDRRAAGQWAFGIYGALAIASYGLIVEGRFPTAYVDGAGLTPFKIGTEYAVIVLLAGGLVLLRRIRHRLDDEVVRPLVASILCTMAAELMFTLYVDVFGIVNAAGHILKFWSYWFILQALLRRGREAADTFPA
ncbi:MASE3 domain-containing protein [Caenispirillum bisanense]|uniref:MASE3 domain-containing protein n=1 Tax=Caenispirillum bisanense TaxID=414052 RepID=UPI0031D2D1DE